MTYAIAKPGFLSTRYVDLISRNGFNISTVAIYDDGSNPGDIWKARKFKTQAAAQKALDLVHQGGHVDFSICQIDA